MKGGWGLREPGTVESRACATAATVRCPHKDSVSGNLEGVTQTRRFDAFGNSLSTLVNGYETVVQAYSKEEKSKAFWERWIRENDVKIPAIQAPPLGNLFSRVTAKDASKP